MSFCQACGTAVETDARFCPRCGKPVNIGVLSSSPEMAATASVGLPLPVSTSVAPASAVAPAHAAPGAQISPGVIPVSRPAGVTVLSIFSFLMAAISAVIGVSCAMLYAAGAAQLSLTLASNPLLRLALGIIVKIFPSVGQLGESAEQYISSFFAFVIIGSFISAAVLAVGSYGLWKRRKWGRLLTIVTYCLFVSHAAVVMFDPSTSTIWQVIVIGLDAWIIVYLFKPHVKHAFGG
jgi:uncharacterized membrane protein (DUF2068 family)